MNENVEYRLNRSSAASIEEHLLICDSDFVPRLSDRVDIREYAVKIAGAATRFEAWHGDRLVGLVAAYFNDPENPDAFITNVSVLGNWTGQGIAASLMDCCLKHAKNSGICRICLEVGVANRRALEFYARIGFSAAKRNRNLVTMHLHLENEQAHERQA